MPIEKVVEIGNAKDDGNQYLFKCPHCNKSSRISDYGGNLIDESTTCPKCDELITNEMIKASLETRIKALKGARVECKQS